MYITGQKTCHTYTAACLILLIYSVFCWSAIGLPRMAAGARESARSISWLDVIKDDLKQVFSFVRFNFASLFVV